jgi:predicted transcriptional regulator of viral defense system
VRRHGSLSEWRLADIRTVAELRAAGRSSAQIETLVRRGTLIQIRRGVYACADEATRVRRYRNGDHILRTAAALATIGPGAVASHQTAASIHYLDLLTEPGTEVTLTRIPGQNRSGRAGLRVHSADLPREHVTEAYGMPVTTPARTVLDLARNLGFRAGVVEADSALHRKLVTKAELESVRSYCSRWPGATQAAGVVAFADALSESALESLARVVFRPDLAHDHGLSTAFMR